MATHPFAFFDIFHPVSISFVCQEGCALQYPERITAIIWMEGARVKIGERGSTG